MSFADRAVAALGFHLQQILSRRLSEPAPLAAAPRELSELRYRLRRDGLRPELLAECFRLCNPESPAAVRAAAARLSEGGIVELADPAARHEALALAAVAQALHGGSVHLIAAAEASAKAWHGRLGPRFAELGLRVAFLEHGMTAAARRQAYACDVVCGTHREIAQDHLRDRLAQGEHRGALRSRLGLAEAGEEPLMPQGLRCALVDDADLVMLDDSLAPAAIAAEVDQSRERLLYEQALELARALQPGKDFTVDADGIGLTEPSARLLERLVTPLGGLWSARQRREELVGLALRALHLLKRDADYRVAAGRVEFPERKQDGEAPSAADDELKKLVEVKEGCRLGARRELLARLPMPRFFARYRRLAGACADARSLEGEFWAFYRLKTWLAGERPEATPAAVRVFASSEARNAALVETLRARAAEGAVVLAARSVREAQALQSLLQGAKVEGAITLAVLPPVQGLPAATRSLLVVGLPDSRRHVEQARAACGAAVCELLFALDEEAVAPRLGVLRFSSAFAQPDGELAPRAGQLVARHALRAAERASRDIRLDLRAREQHLDDLLAFSGQRE